MQEEKHQTPAKDKTLDKADKYLGRFIILMVLLSELFLEKALTYWWLLIGFYLTQMPEKDKEWLKTLIEKVAVSFVTKK